MSVEAIILPYYAKPTSRHLLVAAFHTNPRSVRVVEIVVGKVTVPEDSNDAPQVTDGVPDPAVNEIQIF